MLATIRPGDLVRPAQHHANAGVSCQLFRWPCCTVTVVLPPTEAMTVPTVDVRDIEVLETAVIRAAHPEFVGEWPCPFCGQQRKLADAQSVRVRNRNGGSFERWVLMCDDCLTNGL